jgi:hypothetical protein
MWLFSEADFPQGFNIVTNRSWGHILKEERKSQNHKFEELCFSLLGPQEKDRSLFGSNLGYQNQIAIQRSSWSDFYQSNSELGVRMDPRLETCKGDTPQGMRGWSRGPATRPTTLSSHISSLTLNPFYLLCWSSNELPQSLFLFILLIRIIQVSIFRLMRKTRQRNKKKFH